jgi:hypothetical protein
VQVELTNEEGNVAYTGLLGKSGFSNKVRRLFVNKIDRVSYIYPKPVLLVCVQIEENRVFIFV